MSAVAWWATWWTISQMLVKRSQAVSSTYSIYLIGRLLTQSDLIYWPSSSQLAVKSGQATQVKFKLAFLSFSSSILFCLRVTWRIVQVWSSTSIKKGFSWCVNNVMTFLTQACGWRQHCLIWCAVTCYLQHGQTSCTFLWPLWHQVLVCFGGIKCIDP